jgi:hypothetical protein
MNTHIGAGELCTVRRNRARDSWRRLIRIILDDARTLAALFALAPEHGSSP